MSLVQSPRLDVHILTSATTCPWMQQRCFASIEVARQRAGFPLAIHVIPAVQGHLGIMRYQGYRKGTAPYVTNVDDDDLLLPHAFAVLKPALMGECDAIFPRELLCHCTIDGNRVIEGPRQPGRQRHSMKVFHRKHLIDFRPWLWAGDVAQMVYLEQQSHLVDLDTPSYVWRVYPTSNSMPLRYRDPMELRRAREGHVTMLHPHP